MTKNSRISSVKTYTHAQGLSCCFRQWRADSHCHFLHGYAIQVSIEFSCDVTQLDKNGWVVDFGAMKPFKKWLEDTFDHKLLVAADDPYIKDLQWLTTINVADVLILKNGVGMEAFAWLVMKKAESWLTEYLDTTEARGVYVSKVALNEHETNGVVIYND